MPSQRHPDPSSLLQMALSSGESETVEFMSSITEKHFAQTICAFANTNGGTIYIGVADGEAGKEREIVGIDTEEVLAAFQQIDQHFDPPVPKVSREILNEPFSQGIAAIHVAMADQTIALKDRTIWRRVGSHNTLSNTREASQEQSEPNPDTEPRDAVPLKRVMALKPSQTLSEVIALAQELMREAGAREPLRSSFLIIAMIDHGRKNPDEQQVPSFLAGQVFPTREHKFNKCKTDYLARVRRRATRSTSTIDGAENVSPGLWSDFQKADEIGKVMGLIGVNASQLLAAFLFYRDESRRDGVLQRLREIGFTLDSLRAQFLELMVAHSLGAEHDFWSKLIPKTGQPKSLSPSSSPDALAESEATIALFTADLTNDFDQLEITPDVNAMANLIASRGLKPPLSIGLFGNWGSGKSFFIDRLQSVIKKIAQHAEDDTEYRRYYWTRIVHVRFNAWNYIDANLWASLVSHLFEQLSRWDSKDPPGKFETARREAIDKLRLAQDARKDAEAKKIEAENARDQAKKNKEERESAIDADRDALVAAISKDVWDEVRTKVVVSNPELSQHLEAIGISSQNVQQSAQQVYAHLQEMTTLGGQTRALWIKLTTDPKLRRPVYVTGAAVLGMLALAVGFMFFGQTLLAWLTGVVGEVAVAMAGVATWVKLGSERLAKILKPIRELRSTLDDALKSAEQEKVAKITGLKSRLDQQQAEYEIAVREFDQARVAVSAATAALADVQSGRLISRFIEQRVASGDYRKHLGIVATIRDDFGELNTLISGYNDFLQKRDSNQISGEELAAAEATSKDAEQLGINRIVLYIDDLDRCPPERVVEVLQAVHLLLAFPLFVVVVAVDARWMSHALQDQYPHLLVDPDQLNRHPAHQKDTANRIGAVDAASPRDYLEKIFQVPYWIKAMDSAGCQRLIDSLLDVEGGLPSSKPDNDATDDLIADGRQVGVIPTGSTDGPGPSTATENATTGNVNREIGARDQNAEADRRAAGGDGKKHQETKEEERPQPASLSIDGLEITAMKELAPLIGRSPRETKRFVNIYRLMKAALSREQLATFVGTQDNPGDFQHPMLLLTIATGLPQIAATLLQRIVSLSGSVVDASDGRRKRKSTVEAPALLRNIFGTPENVGRTREQVSEWARLTEFLSKHERWSGLEVGELQKWVGRVSQFTFEPAVDISRTEEES